MHRFVPITNQMYVGFTFIMWDPCTSKNSEHIYIQINAHPRIQGVALRKKTRTGYINLVEEPCQFSKFIAYQEPRTNQMLWKSSIIFTLLTKEASYTGANAVSHISSLIVENVFSAPEAPQALLHRSHIAVGFIHFVLLSTQGNKWTKQFVSSAH